MVILENYRLLKHDSDFPKNDLNTGSFINYTWYLNNNGNYKIAFGIKRQRQVCCKKLDYNSIIKFWKKEISVKFYSNYIFSYYNIVNYNRRQNLLL